MYLQLEPTYFGCDFYAEREGGPNGPNEDVRATCEKAEHSVDVTAIGGSDYVPGNADNGAGVDPAVEGRVSDGEYFEATKVDISLLPAIDARLNGVSFRPATD